MPNNPNHRNHDAPRTFREVGMMVWDLKDDLEEVRKTQEKIVARMDKFVSVLIVSILCPIIVSVVLAFLIKSAK